MQGNITKINYYSCGYCVNNLGLVFRGHGKEKRDFGAGVFLMEHREHGYILFDTGYTTDIYHCGIVGKLYNLFNPTHVTREDMIDQQLMVDGIAPDEIRYIILSHLHPDHIGGLSQFPNAKIIISAKVYERYKAPHMRDLFIRQFIPEFFENNIIVLDDRQLNSTQSQFFSAYDMFGDGSILITNMDGHAYGQIGALVNNRIFLAADTCWGVDLIDKIPQMKYIPSKIQDDYSEYKTVGRTLARMRDNGIELMFSHDKYERKEIM